MANILYGVHGTGHGHAIRALTVARHYPEHRFLFVSHLDGARLLRPHFPVVECANPVTPIRHHRVHASALWTTARHLACGPHWLRVVRDAAEKFRPDVAISDYEFFVPLVARAKRIPCLSLDNQHALTLGRPNVPFRDWCSWGITATSVRCLFSFAPAYLVCCFFHPPAKSRPHVRWAPPLLRDELLRRRPRTGEFALAYQGYSTFPGFTRHLRALGRPVRIYGVESAGTDGPLTYKARNEQEFLDDLADCAYVVCGGGHTLISEALWCGKPVLSIPIHGAYEQQLNAAQVARAGYGQAVSPADFTVSRLRDFEQKRDQYAAQIRRGYRAEQTEIYAALDDFIAGRWR